MLPALGGLCVTPGDILFLCREGWASGRRLGFPSELTGLLYTKLLWLDTGMETGISKLGGGTACGAETGESHVSATERHLQGSQVADDIDFAKENARFQTARCADYHQEEISGCTIRNRLLHRA